MTSPVAVAKTLVALGLGVVCGWSLRGKPGSGEKSNPAGWQAGRVSAIAVGEAAERIDDSPDPFRATPPSVERLVAVWRAAPSRERELEFELAVLQMGAKDLLRLWGAIRGQIDTSDWEGNSVLEPLFKRWGALDIEAAMAAAGEASDVRRWLAGEALAGFATKDLQGALGWVRRQEGSDAKGHYAGEVLDELSKTDAAAAARLLNSLVKEGLVGPGAWSNYRLFERWARRSPEAAAEAALAMRREMDAPRSLESALSVWGRSEPEAAMAWMVEQEGLQNATELLSAVIGGWADLEPEAAADYLVGSGNRELINGAMDDVLREWIEVDFDAAGVWIAGIEDEAQRMEFELMLVESSPWGGESDRTLAYALERIATNPRMADKLERAVWRLSSEDPGRAIDWAEQHLADPAQRAEMVEGVLGHAAWQNPTFVAERIDLLSPGQAREGLYERTARSWARRDLEAAREWVNGLPEGAERDRAVVGVTQQWLEVDVEAAGDWVAGLERGPVRDQLTYQHAMVMGDREKNPQSGLELSRGIADPFLREEAIEDVYERWLNDSSEAEAARAAIGADATLSAAARWRLLNPP